MNSRSLLWQSAGEASDNAAARWQLSKVVTALRESRDVTHNLRRDLPTRRAPSRPAVDELLKGVIAALFPRHHGQADLDDESIDYFVGNALNGALNLLFEEVRREALFASDEEDDGRHDVRSAEIVRTFATSLPEIRGLLVEDLRAAYVGDPAASSFPEILIGYPGMLAIIHHRLAHVLYRAGATIVARLMSEIAHSRTGIDIHPGASIGASFFIDHGTGVVIGETSMIGARVRIYQAVTLGARNFPTDENGAAVRGNARHPILEDDVTVYAGATILGRVVIGRNSIIGGNVWLTQDVAPGSFVTQATARSRKSTEP
ncbi:serine O-acetyltransferase EpsC [Bradyrhizobium sp. LHD-71]|uniref:serine O-acetyltransferase EpsC n=1 Tax=Bradyrhizobium sp. LHD-71 TaxID=3072141 RepID=UPI0028101082|nr:serine O-acetyltransferase EpsC [Bradyrhizobium sp. LHD-71]MDQ8728172.1 serine O-acetyltransferase EpsC [Bradyrhizobium sp. LHD-71]